MAKKDKNSVEVQPTADNETKGKKVNTILEELGKVAIKEHGLPEVFVTSDGMVFRTDNDARNYATNLQDKSILKIKK